MSRTGTGGRVRERAKTETEVEQDANRRRMLRYKSPVGDARIRISISPRIQGLPPSHLPPVSFVYLSQQWHKSHSRPRAVYPLTRL